MITPTWPAGLPQRFLVDGYGEGLRDNLIRSETDIGPAKVRRRATAAPWPLTGSMLMTFAQYETFRDFVEDDLEDGAKTFWLPNQRAESGTWLVRFTEPASAQPLGVDLRVSLSLEVLP